jgi:hypothetical protein
MQKLCKAMGFAVTLYEGKRPTVQQLFNRTSQSHAKEQLNTRKDLETTYD